MTQFRLLSFYNRRDVENDEGFYLSPGETKLLLHSFRQSKRIGEALVISDSERTEILYYAKKDLGEWIYDQIRIIAVSRNLQVKSIFQQTADEKRCFNHLAELCFGFHATTFGSHQRFDKFLMAYNLSMEAKLNGEYLDGLMNTFVEANTLIKSKTNYQTANFSISFTIADLVSEFVKKIKNPKIAIVGFNALGKKVYTKLLEKGYGRVTIVEKSIKPFSGFADLDPSTFIFEPFSQIENVIKEHDIVINTLDDIDGIIKPHYFSLPSMKIILDLALQGNMHTSFSQLDQVILFELTDVHKIIEKKIELNKKCMGKVKAIVHQKMEQFGSWMDQKKGKALLSVVKKILEDSKGIDEQIDQVLINRNTTVQERTLPHHANMNLLRQSIEKIKNHPKHQKSITFEVALDFSFKFN